MDTLREVSAKKPILIQVRRWASRSACRFSHTGSLAGNDRAYATAIKQSGGICRRPEFVDLATAFALQPVPSGNRVAIVTNAGGPGILVTDNIENAGNGNCRLTAETTAI